MIKWFFEKIFLEQQELLFIISISVIMLVIIATVYLVHKELVKENVNS